MKNPVRIQRHVDLDEIPAEITAQVERADAKYSGVSGLFNYVSSAFLGEKDFEEINLMEMSADIDTLRQRLATFDLYLLDLENLIRGYLQLKLAEKEKNIPNGEESENENVD